MSVITNGIEAADFFMDVKGIRRTKGLERMRTLLSRLGDPHKKLRFVHVAGTNGKGSTCACISSILRQSGYKTGLYISPHLKSFNERISVNGVDIPDDELVTIANIIKPIAESMDEYPSVFELVTAAGMLHFYRNECDIVVLEVGLGGILDSTNVIDTPEVAVITAVGLDHCAILGDTIPEVAWNKAGIIKAGGRAVAYPVSPDVDAVYVKQSCAVGAQLRFADFSSLDVISTSLNKITFTYKDLHNIELPLVGTYQPKNAAVAIEAAYFLREQGWMISDQDIVAGLKNTVWPGRFDVLRERPYFILDGSHNPHGFAATAESLSHYFPGKKFIFLMGIMEDKDHAGVADLVCPLASHIVTVAVDYSRAMPAEKLAEELRSRGAAAESTNSVSEAVNQVLKYADTDDVICAFGSLYISSDIRECVNSLKK